MYKELLEALKTKFQGVSENILARQARKLENTVSNAEQVKTAIDGVSLQQLIDSYADSRANEATQTAVQNYEKKHGLKDGKPAQQNTPPIVPQNPPKDDNDVPAWAKAIIESNKALSEQVKAMQGEKITNTRRTQIADITSKLSETLRKPYGHITVDTLSDEDFTKMCGEIQAEVEAIAKEAATKGAVFGKPTVKGGSGTQQTVHAGAEQATDAEVEAVTAKLGI